MRKILAAWLGSTTGAAGIVALILTPGLTFLIWLSVTVLGVLIIYVLRREYSFVRVTSTWTATLSMLQDVIEDIDCATVFVFAAYNFGSDLVHHDYFDETIRRIRNGTIEEYTRVVTSGSEASNESLIQMLELFGRYPRVRLGTLRAEIAPPMNILTISPHTVILGFPREPRTGTVQQDAVAILFRSKTVYQAISTVREWIWSRATPIKKAVELSDAELQTALTSLRAGAVLSGSNGPG
jgi:hypothetical protein